MNLVLLCAGRGTRLKPITDSTPKVLVEVQGVPILGRMLNEVSSTSISKVIVVVGYLGDQVSEYCLANFPNLNFEFVYQEPLDGTAGAVIQAKGLIESGFFVLFGDGIYKTGDLESFFNADEENLVMTTWSDYPQRYGVVSFADGGNIGLLEEKPPQPKSNLVIAGAYKFCFETLRHFTSDTKKSIRGEYELPDFVNAMIAAGINFGSFEVSYMVDAGTHDALRELQNRDLD